MRNITIKKAVAEDAVTLSVLGQITFTETYQNVFKDVSDLIAYCQSSFSIEQLTKNILDNNNIYLLAYGNDLPVGYAKVRLSAKSSLVNQGRSSQLERIYVLKEHLGIGIGLKLKKSVIEQLKQQDFDCIWLQVSQTNYRAIRFYKKHGFSILGKEPFIVGNKGYEAYTMTKNISYEKL